MSYLIVIRTFSGKIILNHSALMCTNDVSTDKRFHFLCRCHENRSKANRKDVKPAKKKNKRTRNRIIWSKQWFEFCLAFSSPFSFWAFRCASCSNDSLSTSFENHCSHSPRRCYRYAMWYLHLLSEFHPRTMLFSLHDASKTSNFIGKSGEYEWKIEKRNTNQRWSFVFSEKN